MALVELWDSSARQSLQLSSLSRLCFYHRAPWKTRCSLPFRHQGPHSYIDASGARVRFLKQPKCRSCPDCDPPLKWCPKHAARYAGLEGTLPPLEYVVRDPKPNYYVEPLDHRSLLICKKCKRLAMPCPEHERCPECNMIGPCSYLCPIRETRNAERKLKLHPPKALTETKRLQRNADCIRYQKRKAARRYTDELTAYAEALASGNLNAKPPRRRPRKDAP